MGDRQTSRIVAQCIEAKDPPRLAEFWADALGWDIDVAFAEDASGAVRLVPTDGTRFPVVLVPTPVQKVGKNRVHFDLTTTSLDDQARTVERLVELGGRHLDIGQRADEDHVVLADPEGNELCIIGPGNRFLAGCDRLGAINSDGTRRVGCFWSDVLGWPLVWDQDEETAIRAPDGTGPLITWSGPPLIPKSGRNRLYLDIAPPAGVARSAEIDRLVSLGATVIEAERADGCVLLVDPDDNEFRLSS